jgi:SNF2 family DNA or RNA helicase
MQAVFDDMSLCLADDPFSKFVIFSQYPESLIALKAKLHLLNGTAVSARAAIVTPTMTPALKAASLKQFNEDPLCNVILLSMGSASSGLTLTVAHVCYLLEPTHNAADEAQALSRVHRIGQTKTTRCVIFYARDTMEERLLAQRQLKGQLTELIQCPNQDLPEQGIGVESDKQTRNAFFAAENMKTLFGLRSE